MATLLDIAGLRSQTTPEFRQALYDQATAAGYDPSFIAAVLRLESNFNPAAINPGGHAAGILQWWDSLFPNTAAAAGRSDVQWSDLPSMSAEQQLPFVIAYLQQATAAQLTTPTDYRLAVFMPAFVGASPGTVLGQRGSSQLLPGTNLSLGTIYSQNQGLDTNGDGLITVADVGNQIESLVADARTRAPIELSSDAADTLPPGGSIATPAMLLTLAGLFFCPHCSARCPVKVVFERLEPHHDAPHFAIDPHHPHHV
jgi:tail lysozyme